MSASERRASRAMLTVFVLCSGVLWIADSLFDFLWFNLQGKDYLELMLPLDRPHEMFMRTLMVSILLISGGGVSRMYGKLAASERQARESEKELSITFKSIGDAIIATDAKGLVFRMNPVAEEMTGWSLEEALGKPLDDVFKIINAETGDVCESPVKSLSSPKKNVGLANHTMLISKTGEKFKISDSAAPIINEEGLAEGAVLIFCDVSEEYRQEKELHQLRNYLSNIIDSMPSILVGVDCSGKVTQWNVMAERATGIPAEQAMGSPLSDVFPRLSKQMEQVRESIKTRTANQQLRTPRVVEDGIRYEDIIVYPLISNGVEGAVIQVYDVTEQFNLEQMMIQTEKMISVGGLAAGMAHEINNPLAAIAGNAQNISNRIYKDLKRNEDVACECEITLEKIREYLSKRDIPRMLEGISDSCNRAAKIVTNMLKFSRKSDKKFSYCNLTELMDETIDLASNDYDLKKEYDFRQIKIIKEYSPDLPDVFCEENEIQQVLLNLLRNGAQAMNEKVYGDGEPCLSIRFMQEEDTVRIEVEDNGTGITEKVRRRVFEPFYSTKGVGHGTGLGLSVSYFIITDQHNGVMEVESLLGHWTRFIIKLPIAGSRIRS